MATGEQIKSLIKSHLGNDEERFLTIALQLAAHEARKGHVDLAHAIRELIEKARKEKRRPSALPPALEGLVRMERPEAALNMLVINEGLKSRIQRIIHEYRQRTKLKSYGLLHRRKVLLVGPPGTGKTMTAKVLARELRLPLHIIQMDRLVTKFMGETSARLRQIFDLIESRPGVYLFDEFDAIGGERSMDNDVGEMRRVLNAFLQFVEQYSSDSLVLAATNNPALLDQALFRRFDDVLEYACPTEAERKELVLNVLGAFKPVRIGWTSILKKSAGLSHADIVLACTDAVKTAVLEDRKKTTTGTIVKMLEHRRKVYKKMR